MAIARVTTLPASWYTDPEILRLEGEQIFRRTWQYVARADQVAEPGQYVAARAGDVPVVVVRDGETLRGFVNVCRHRGHEVVSGAGVRKSLQCPYHAWTYGLDGCLRAAPRADREPGLDLGDLSLLPVAVGEWGPFVFVNPDADAPPLEEHLGELPALLAESGLHLGALRFRHRVEWEVEANWKVVAENFLECYHCAVAHPGFSSVVDVAPEAYRLEAHETFLSQYGSVHGAVRSGKRSGPYDAVGEVEGQFHLVWPNFVMNVMPGRPNLSAGTILPAGPGRAARLLDYWFAGDADEGWVRDLLAFDDQVGREDEALVESVQRGLGSGMLERGQLLGESEKLIVAFESMVERALR
ncbi:MAG TPA: aromatic ring-hydroxylating dioxygenase subunit alpha [Gaiellaceae bacterium]|nr:aromatic ring-hydroxylating dioxygenase subunit alpha [Gaiellaceae bacterium]